MNGREDKWDSHKGVFKVYFLWAEGTKSFQQSKSKAGNFNWQHHCSIYWLIAAFNQAFQAAKATHCLEEHLELYTWSSYLSLWKKPRANSIFQLIGQERSCYDTESILYKAQPLSSPGAGCVIILPGAHFCRWGTQSSSHNCSTL